jgi:hypothetical protein
MICENSPIPANKGKIAFREAGRGRNGARLNAKRLRGITLALQIKLI